MARFFNVLFVLLTTTALGEPLKCQDGMAYKSQSIENEGVMVEWCEDAEGLKQGGLRFVRENDKQPQAEYQFHKGQKHGPAYIYNDEGVMVMEITFANGREISARLSEFELRRVLEEKNDEARKTGKRWRINLINAQIIQYDVTVTFPWWLFISDESNIAETLSSNPQICSLFDMQGTDIRLIRVRYIKSDGSELVTAVIKPDDCKGVG